MTYERPISAIDRSFFSQPYLNGSPVRQRVNQFILEGEGELDLAEWRAAVAKAAKANPSISLIKQGHLGRAKWVPGPPPNVELIENHNWDGQSSEDAPFLDRTFDLHQGPTSDILLLPGSPSRVVFTSHHAIMDGMSTRFFIDSVFQALRGETVKPNLSAITNYDIVVGAGKMERPPRKPVKKALEFLGGAEEAERGSVWRRAFIPGNFKNSSTAVLYELSKLVHANNESDGDVRIKMPINMRRHIDDKQAMGNLSFPVSLDVDKGDSEATVTKKFLTLLKQKQDLCYQLPAAMKMITWVPGFVWQFQTNISTPSMHTAIRAVSSGGFSTLGFLAPNEYQSPNFKTHSAWVVPVSVMVNFFATSWENERGIEICLGMPRIMATNGRLEKGLAQITAALTERTERLKR